MLSYLQLRCQDELWFYSQRLDSKDYFFLGSWRRCAWRQILLDGRWNVSKNQEKEVQLRPGMTREPALVLPVWCWSWNRHGNTSRGHYWALSPPTARRREHQCWADWFLIAAASLPSSPSRLEVDPSLSQLVDWMVPRVPMAPKAKANLISTKKK